MQGKYFKTNLESGIYMKEIILSKLKEIENEYRVKILYAVES